MPRHRTRGEASLEERVARLSAILEEQRRELDELRRILPHTDGSPSRRDLLRLAGAAVAGAAGSVALQAIPVSAANGGAMTLGQANDANATTDLHPTTATPASPLLHIDASAASNNAVALMVAGANNANAAVLQGSGTGSGLSASSNLGNAVSGQAGGGATSNGVAGTAGAGVTSYGIVGTAGAGLSSVGVVGNAGPGNASAGVVGNAGGALSSAGVVGAASVGYGVFGQAASGIDMIAGGNGRLAQVPFSLGGAGAPNMTPGAGVLEMLREDDGSIWASRALAGAPIGTFQAAWKRLNAVRVDALDGTGNPFVAARVLDTRNGTGSGAHVGPLLGGQSFDFGPFTGIPSDAVGLFGNLTAVASDGAGNPAPTFAIPGWLALTPGGVAAPVSNVNYGGPVNAVPNFFMVGFGTGSNAGKLRIQNGGNTKVHVLLDVFGILQ
ncbi:MAG TPA: hypothetical protein VHK65_03720 [Candidatus Dormibacteraeota bacterium]|nr:hypothetical protein [Candidatus Dormibacteraeota bacterium]